MMKDKDAIATAAVRDLAAARKFYEGTLGLEPLPGSEKSAQSYKAGRSTLLVYESGYAGTNQATAVTWAVGDVDGTVQALKAKGVAFERYDMPGMTREGDVHVGGGIRVAWFKDPDGNIHSLVAEP